MLKKQILRFCVSMHKKFITVSAGHVLSYKNPDFWLQVAKICSAKTGKTKLNSYGLVMASCLINIVILS